MAEKVERRLTVIVSADVVGYALLDIHLPPASLYSRVFATRRLAARGLKRT